MTGVDEIVKMLYQRDDEDGEGDFAGAALRENEHQ